MTGPGTLDDLTTQLADFMDLADSKDLPPLYAVKLHRNRHETEWHAEAQISCTFDTAWDAVRGWAVATGGTVRLGDAVRGDRRDYRPLDVTVSYVGLRVRVWTHVAADGTVPDWYAPECLDERIEHVEAPAAVAR